jgi:MmyB-like transcription regulator ligand binding domain
VTLTSRRRRSTPLRERLRMDGTERTHLFMLARQPLPAQPPPDEETTPVLRRVLANVGISPAYVTGRRWNVLAWNEAAEVVFGDFGAKMGRERNLLWRSFTDMEWRQRIVDWETHAQCIMAQFRVAYGQHVGDDACTQLVRDLQQISPEFARWWPRHDVRERPGGRKEFRHPTAGVLVLEDSLFQTFSSGGCTRPADIFLYPLDEADTPAKLQKLVAGRPCISPTDQQPPRKQSAR